MGGVAVPKVFAAAFTQAYEFGAMFRNFDCKIVFCVCHWGFFAEFIVLTECYLTDRIELLSNSTEQIHITNIHLFAQITKNVVFCTITLRQVSVP